ncbi:hypothetical protein [Chryseobacterium sp.]|uniref:hypothetical protein n=1 Tax=Chryseobacterium sp. TaxID=1871047 RepID=UPI0025C37C12|nr:hypothetical protein [Chryseobacterium sp.]MBV8325000.1 hypothetical protein [Chryseobacterium sp.]
MSKVFFIVAALIVGFIIIDMLLTKDQVINRNSFSLTDHDCTLEGNGTVLFFNSDDNTVKYQIDDKTRKTFTIEQEDGKTLLYQKVRTNIYIRLFNRNREYPVIRVYLPKEMSKFDFKLYRNGDFIFKDPFRIDQSVFRLEGNGDMFSSSKLMIKHCFLEVLKNGSIKLNQISGDVLQYRITDNGNIKASGEFLTKEKL